MASPTCADSPRSAVAASELVMSVHGGPRHGQIVRIRSPKCSVGSDQRCTLRLRARGILPMHCLIVRGSTAAYVRRWAPDTRLNGGGFDDAVLRPGDRLSVGPVEFTIVHTGGESSELQSGAPTTSAEPTSDLQTRPAIQAPQSESPARSADVAGQDTGLAARSGANASAEAAQRTELAHENRRLHDDWAALNDRRRQFDDQCREAREAQEAAEARLLAKQAELERWEARLTQAQRTLSEREGEIEQQACALAAEREELERTRHSLDAKLARFTAESSEIDRRLTIQAADLTRQRIELSRQQEELELLRQQLAVRHVGRQDRADAQSPGTSPCAASADAPAALPLIDVAADADSPIHSDDQPSRESPSAARDCDIADHSFAHSGGPNDPREAEPASADRNDSSLSLEDVLRRLGRREDHAADQPSPSDIGEAEAEPCECPGASNADQSIRIRRASSSAATGFSVASEPEDARGNGPDTFNRWSWEQTDRAEPDELIAEPANEPACSADRGQRTAADSGREESGDDDIDSYMADLMRRLGKPHQPPPRQQATEPPPRRYDHQEDETQLKPAAAAETDAQPDTQRRPLSELAPRAIAPEKQTDIGAMRELANQSTRSALDQHAWRSLGQTARSRLATTATMAIVGLGLLWLHFFWIANQLALIAGLSALGFGGFLMFQYVWTAFRLLTHERPAGNGDVSRTAAEAEQPAAADVTAEAADAMNEQTTGPARIDLDRLDALVARTRARCVSTEPGEPSDEPQ